MRAANGLRRLVTDLASKATRATDAVNVVLTVPGQVVVDDERDLLHIETARPDVGRDEHARGALPELGHDRVTLLCAGVRAGASGAHALCGISPCMAETVKLDSRIFSVSQSTWACQYELEDRASAPCDECCRR